LQHGPAVDGRGLDAKVKQFNSSDLSCYSYSCFVTDSETHRVTACKSFSF